jgi:hypothetical protein
LRRHGRPAGGAAFARHQRRSVRPPCRVPPVATRPRSRLSRSRSQMWQRRRGSSRLPGGQRVNVPQIVHLLDPRLRDDHVAPRAVARRTPEGGRRKAARRAYPGDGRRRRRVRSGGTPERARLARDEVGHSASHGCQTRRRAPLGPLHGRQHRA